MKLMPNRDRLQSLIGELGLDALIAMSPENYSNHKPDRRGYHQCVGELTDQQHPFQCIQQP